MLNRTFIEDFLILENNNVRVMNRIKTAPISGGRFYLEGRKDLNPRPQDYDSLGLDHH